MRVVHVITGLHVGGAESMLLKLLETMDASRFGPVVVSLMAGGENRSRVEALGVPVHDLGLGAGLPGPAAVLELRRLARRLRPDVVQGWMYHGNLAGSLLGFFAPDRPGTIWNVRHSVADLGREKRGTRLAIRAGAALSGRPRRIVYNSGESLAQHGNLGYRRDKALVIPNGFDLDRFRPSPDAGNDLRDELGLPREARLVGVAARRHPMKGHEEFLRAAGRMDPVDGDVHFLLVGRGVIPEDAILRDLAGQSALAGRVHLLGQREDMPGFLAALDLLCMPSLYGEGFPNVLGEAMACGVRCLATDVGDAREIVGETGLVVAPGDVPALAAGLTSLLSRGPGESGAAAEACRLRIRENYALEKIAGLYAELYESC